MLDASQGWRVDPILAPEQLPTLDAPVLCDVRTGPNAADDYARGHLPGAIFIGPMTPEAAGDYLAGPSHVLPTGGAARYASPLGVYDFVSRTSLIGYDRGALELQGPAISAFARAEGLEAHARAVEARLSRS